MKKTFLLVCILSFLGSYACSKKESTPIPESIPAPESKKIEPILETGEKKPEAETQGHWDKAGHEIKEAFKETGHDIKKGSEKAGSEMKKGFEKAGHSIKDAFK